MSKIRMIAAIDIRRGLARKNIIPWKLPADTKYYQDMTMGNSVVLGKNTYFAIGPSILAKRYSHIYVVAHEQIEVENGEVISDISKLANDIAEDLWVLGGGSVYQQFLPYADELYLTQVSGDYNCDVFFPDFEDTFELATKSAEMNHNGIDFRFEKWISLG
ncbi:MAG: dihydrofolate reductase [bacterium]|nr:dihydrofolate reductase [bacterium]